MGPYHSVMVPSVPGDTCSSRANCMSIPDKQYALIRRHVPMLCVDILIYNDRYEWLLVRRRNPPLAGRWWVPGGRVLRGEALMHAAERKIAEEIGDDARVQIWKNPIGCFRLVTPDRDSLSLLFKASYVDGEITLDQQSLAWMWSAHLPKLLREEAVMWA